MKSHAANPNESKHWLTPERLRTHGLLLGMILWLVYAWVLAVPGIRDRNNNIKGTDFLHFYTIGTLAIERRGQDLYNPGSQEVTATQLVPAAAGIRYLPLYPPQVSLLFAPLAHCSYGWALALWWMVNTSIYGACVYCLWRVSRSVRDHKGLVLVLAIAFPAFFNLVAWGQTSGLALACFTAMFLLLRRRQTFLAGLVLGCLIYKPQLGIAPAIVFAAVGAWKVVGGAAIGSVLELSLGAFYYGLDPLREWSRTLLHMGSVLPLLEPRPYQTHCLRTFWSMILPWEGVAFGVYVVSALLILALTIAIWKRGEIVPLSLRYSALLLATVLVSPHLTVYDLVILAPAILLLADWALGQRSSVQRGVGTLLYLVYALPLLAPLTRWTHIQLSVIVMTILVFAIWRISKKSPAFSGSEGLSDRAVTVPAR